MSAIDELTKNFNNIKTTVGSAIDKFVQKPTLSPYQDKYYSYTPPTAIPDNSTAGIIKNTILGLPKAALDVTKNIGQGIARSVATVGTTAGNIPAQITGTPKPFNESIDTTGNPISNALFGGQPIKTVQKQSADVQQFLKPYVGETTSKYSALPLVLGSIAMDLSGFGGGKAVKLATGEIPEAFIKYLVKNEAPAIEETLVKGGLNSLESKVLATKLGPAKTAQEVKDILIAHETPGLVKSKIPLSGNESPQDLLALAEKNAAEKHLKFDLNNNPIPYTAKEKTLVGKSVPFMPTQKSSLPSSPIDTTTGEGRSLEIAARQNIEEASQHIVPPKDVSLIDTISKEPTPVKNKVNIIDYIRTPDRVLEKIGLKDEAALLRTQHDKYLKELPTEIDKVTNWLKEIGSKDKQTDVFRYLDGKAIELPPESKKVALQIKSYLKTLADRMGLPEDQRITHYITHLFDPELIKKEFPEELAKMIADKLPGEVYNPFMQSRLGTLGYKEDLGGALDAYVKRAIRKIHMDPALESVKDASGKLEKSQYDYVKSYIANINMRPNKVDTLIDNGIKQVIGYRLGERPLLAVTKLLRQMTFRAFLGLNPASALKNISQGINTYSKLGEKYTTIGYAKLFQKGAKAELEAEGVLNGGFIEDRALSSTKKAIEKFDKGLFYFFEKAEHINRGAAYFGAKSQGLSKGMSEPEAIDYAKKIVRDTQFVFGKIDTPLILASDLGKTIGQFQSFTTKQIEFLGEMAKKAATGDEKAKNFLGLLRYAVAGTVFVYTVGQAFNMKISDIIPKIPFFQEGKFGTPPSLQFPIEATKAILGTKDKYGNERDLNQKLKDVGSAALSLIPASTQAKKTYQGYEAMKQGKSTDSAGRAQFDVGGTPLKDAQALIFGKYSGQGAQDYYQNDMTYTEATLANLKKSPTGKSDLAKIIKENPALAQGILQVVKKQALGITKEDEKLLSLGVATKARAKEVAKQINKLDNKEAKRALVAEYIKKKIITDNVAKQLPEFLKK